MAVELREARRGDELAVAELHVRSWQEAYRGLMPAEFLAALDPRDRAGRYASRMRRGRRRCCALSAGEGGEGDPSSRTAGRFVQGPPGSLGPLLGFVTFGESRDDDARGLGEVYALYVDPAIAIGAASGGC